MLETIVKAIDGVFVVRFVVAFVTYWFLGVLTKGIFEPLQSHIGKLLFAKLNKHVKQLEDYANQTCTEIDDIIITHVANSTSRIDGIINRNDLSPTDQQLYRQLVNENYQLSILLKKLGLKNE